MKRFLAVLLCLLLAVCASGCNSSGSSNNVRIAMSTLPTNLDPQLAESAEELAIVRNCFEGLFRFDGDKVKKAACSDYSTSSDGLIWTFTLRKGIKWSDGKAVTAADFAFGIKRALNPDTIAPFASLLYCIKGGEAALKGEADPNDAAVYEKDGKLVIELVKAEKNLPEVLSKAMCMPCREDVFTRAGGRYGMSSELIVCNGPYALSSISKSVQIIKNEHYKGDFGALFAKATFTYGSTDSQRIESLSNSISALASISGSSIDEASQAGLEMTVFNDTAWMVVINPAAKVAGDSKVSAALKSAVDSQSYADALPAGFECYGGAVAPQLLIGGKSYGNTVKAPAPLKGSNGARQALVDALKKHSGKMPTLTLIYPDGKELKQTAARLAQYWQQELGAVINIEAVSEASLSNRLSAGEYQLAIAPLSADDGNAATALRTMIGTDGKGKFGFTIERVNAHSIAGELSAEKVAQTEKMILSDPHIIPIAVSGHYYAHNSLGKDISLDMLQGGIKLYK